METLATLSACWGLPILQPPQARPLAAAFVSKPRQKETFPVHMLARRMKNYILSFLLLPLGPSLPSKHDAGPRISWAAFAQTRQPGLDPWGSGSTESSWPFRAAGTSVSTSDGWLQWERGLQTKSLTNTVTGKNKIDPEHQQLAVSRTREGPGRGS